MQSDADFIMAVIGGGIIVISAASLIALVSFLI